jgi:hypothetical protein
MRPRGTPPTPSAASTPIDPVEIELMAANSFAPRRMIEPLPNCRSICVSALSAAFSLSVGMAMNLAPLVLKTGVLRGRRRHTAARSKVGSKGHR